MWAPTAYSILLLVCFARVAAVKEGHNCDEVTYYYYRYGGYTYEVCTESDVTNNILLARCTVIPKPKKCAHYLPAISYWYTLYDYHQNNSGQNEDWVGNSCEFSLIQEEYSCFMRANISEFTNISAQFGCTAYWDVSRTVALTFYSNEGISSLSPYGVTWKQPDYKDRLPELSLSRDGTDLPRGFQLQYTEGEQFTLTCTVLYPFYGPLQRVLWSLEGRPIKEENINEPITVTSVLIMNFTANEHLNVLQCSHYQLSKTIGSQMKYEHVIPTKVILMLRKPTGNVSSYETFADAANNGTSGETVTRGASEKTVTEVVGDVKTVTESLDVGSPSRIPAPVLWGSVAGALLCAAAAAAVAAYCWRNCQDRRSVKIIRYESSASTVTEEAVYSVPLPRAMRQRELRPDQVVYANLNHGAAEEQDGGAVYVNWADSDNYAEIIGVMRHPR